MRLASNPRPRNVRASRQNPIPIRSRSIRSAHSGAKANPRPRLKCCACICAVAAAPIRCTRNIANYCTRSMTRPHCCAMARSIAASCRHRTRTASPSTRCANARHAIQRFAREFAHLRMDQFVPKLAEDYITRRMHARTRQGRALSGGTVTWRSAQGHATRHRVRQWPIVFLIKSDPEGPGRTKSGKLRRVPLNAVALAALGSDYLLPRSDPHSLTRAFARSAELAGIAGSLHWTRHTFCTSLLLARASIRDVQALAGHASITTIERYLSAVPEHFADAVERIGLVPKVRPKVRQKSGKSARDCIGFGSHKPQQIAQPARLIARQSIVSIGQAVGRASFRMLHVFGGYLFL